jgi:stalled ribosome rescue protein Dom34
MQKKAGVWIDHRQAVIVTAGGGGKEINRIQSNLEKHVRRPSEHARSTDNGPEDQCDRAFTGHLSRYYDKVISRIGNAESVLILGPGEAKEELKERLESNPPHGRMIVLETMDKMTDRQIAEKVRRHFLR